MGNLCASCESKSSNGMLTSNNSICPEKVAEGKFCECSIQIHSGDLLKEQSDAIVTIIDPSLSFSGKICRSILQQAGRSLITDLSKIQAQKRNIEFGQVFYTHAGDMDFDFIFFAVLPPQWDDNPDYMMKFRLGIGEKDMENVNSQLLSPACKHQKQYVFQCINEILRLAEDLGLNSISFPVISVENIKSCKSLTATIMLLAIKAFVEENQHKMHNLQLIAITVLDPNMLNIFKWAYEKIILGSPDNNNIQTQEPIVEQKQNKFSIASFHEPEKPVVEITQPGNQESDLLRFGHSYLNKSKLERKESI